MPKGRFHSLNRLRDRTPMRQIILIPDEHGVGYTVAVPRLPGLHL